MSTFSNIVYGIRALAKVNGTAPEYLAQRGFSGLVIRNNAGDYTLTLEVPLNQNRAIVEFTPNDVVPIGAGGFGTVFLSNTQIRVFIDGGNDFLFSITVKEVSPV